MSEDVQKMFGAIAPRYDRLNHLLSLGLDRFWRRQAVRRLATCKHVVDLCAGTLDLSIELAKQSPETQIDAIDFSQEMLDFGYEKLTGTIAKQIQTHCGDVLQLPFTDQSFDGAMVAYGLRNADDNQRALEEVLRVLRPGGRLVILEFFRPDRLTAKIFHATYGRTVVPVLGGLASGHWGAYKYLRDSVRAFHTVAEYQDIMSLCGFHNIQYKHQLGGASTLIYGEK